MRWIPAGIVALTMLSPALARAEVQFEIVEADDGLLDPAPRKPVGGNPGTTLGAQRRNMIERALATWGKHLESDVPIEVEVSFLAMGCSGNAFPVAGTSVGHWISIRQPGSTAPLVYPSALANRLLGVDSYPDSPDLSVEINSSLDTSACRNANVYYGFEPPKNEASTYLLTALLHEFAHGLGFSSDVNLSTGAPSSPDGLDVFSAHIRDLDLDRTWAELTAAQRARSALNVRRLVFDGATTNAATAGALGAGTATLTFEPAIDGFTGWLGDTGFGQNPALSPARGPLVVAYGADLCMMPAGSMMGGVSKPVLLVEDNVSPSATGCTLDQLLDNARSGGAVGVVLPLTHLDHAPVPSLDRGAAPVALPIVLVSLSDANLIARAATRRAVTAVLGGRKDQREGADPLGRPFLYATTPIVDGSSVSHFDTLARPNLLMEAYISPDAVDDLDLTVPVLRDLGWTVLCGNGKLDGKEACDEGAANSDGAADHCRTTCKLAGCGDSVVDQGEGCDNGIKNSDSTPGACRTTCIPARCGDGVLDPGEGCDEGPANGGTAKGACRLTCSIIGCGDGVLDNGEACDQGPANSDSAPNACRTTCLAPSCGDHVVDDGEACDGDKTCTSHCARDPIVTWQPIESALGTNTSASTTEPARPSGDCSVTQTRPTLPFPLAVLLTVSAFMARRRCRRTDPTRGCGPTRVRREHEKTVRLRLRQCDDMGARRAPESRFRPAHRRGGERAPAAAPRSGRPR